MNVSLSGIVVQFGKVTALSGVDLDLQAGEVAVLAGPNGAGKSTLMSVLLGLVEPDAGHLVVDGVDLLEAGARAHRQFRADLGYLPEAVAFAENLTGRQVMRFFAMARGVKRARISAVLERVGLGEASHRAVRGYSRGMRQRLGLGVAILSEPDLLVLDEPTGGLDQQGLSLLWDVLKEYKDAGRRVLMSSHDLTLIERRADCVHILSAGKVKASGTPDMLRRLAGLAVRVRVELQDPSRMEGLAGSLSEDLMVPVDLGEREVGLSIPPSALFQMFRTVEGQDAEVSQLRVEEPGLDAVYERLLEAP